LRSWNAAVLRRFIEPLSAVISDSLTARWKATLGQYRNDAAKPRMDTNETRTGIRNGKWVNHFHQNVSVPAHPHFTSDGSIRVHLWVIRLHRSDSGSPNLLWLIEANAMFVSKTRKQA
jgi:hypothetical protein